MLRKVYDVHPWPLLNGALVLTVMESVIHQFPCVLDTEIGDDTLVFVLQMERKAK